MSTIIKKEINGYGPYKYRVTYEGGSHNWEYIGKAGDDTAEQTDVPHKESTEPVTDIDNWTFEERDGHGYQWKHERKRMNGGDMLLQVQPAENHDSWIVRLGFTDQLRAVTIHETDTKYGSIQKANNWLGQHADNPPMDPDAIRNDRDDQENNATTDAPEDRDDQEQPMLRDDRDRQAALDVGEDAARTADRTGQSTQGASTQFRDDRDDTKSGSNDLEDTTLFEETEEIEGQQSLSGDQAQTTETPEWQEE